MPKSPQKPSIGRIVMYVPEPGSYESYNSATLVPAIVLRPVEETCYDNDEVNLKVFVDGPETTWHTAVPYDPDKSPRSWHWPERV